MEKKVNVSGRDTGKDVFDIFRSLYYDIGSIKLYMDAVILRMQGNSRQFPEVTVRFRHRLIPTVIRTKGA